MKMAYVRIHKVSHNNSLFFLLFIAVFQFVTVNVSNASSLSVNPSFLPRTRDGNREKFHIKINVNEEFNSTPKNHIANSFRRYIRSAASELPQSTPFSFNDSHYIAKVHWSGSNSSTILILMTDPDFMLSSLRPSYFYISRDYGKTFKNYTDDLILPNRTHAVVTDFFSSSADNNKYILVAKFHQYIFQSDDEWNSFQRVAVPFKPIEIKYHPRNAYYVMAYEKDEGNKMLYVSTRNGKSWQYKASRVVNYFWGYAPPYDFGIDLYFQREKYYDYGGMVHKASPWGFFSSSVIAYDVVDFKLVEEYMFIVKNGTDPTYKTLQVSVNRGEFQNTTFPIQNALSYIIADATEDEVMVAVAHEKVANLYISGRDGTKFSLSMTNILYYNENDGRKRFFEHDFVELYKVEGISGIYIATQLSSEEVGRRNLQSYITFDKGGEWSLIRAPVDSENCSIESRCSLHISLEFGYHNPYTRFTPAFSKKSAPGFIIATGSVGSSLTSSPSVYFSSNAGISWKKIFDGNYYYAFVDHGGVIVGVEKYGMTSYLRYSYDEGNTWYSYNFYKTPLRIYGLLTEPGEKTTVFTLFGSLPEAHSWIVIQVDMKLVLGNQCQEKDYKTWEVTDLRNSTQHCLLGKKQIYKRRDPTSLCYNGYDYDRPISSFPCLCTREDYDCDFGFKLSWKGWSSISCAPDTDNIFSANQTIPAWCKPGKFYNHSTGYRKVPGDECNGGIEDQLNPILRACPIKKSSEYLFYSTRRNIYRYDFVTKEVIEFDLNDMKNVVSLEVDYNSNVLFYADIMLDKIVVMNMNTGNISVLLQMNNSVVHIEALSYDWMNGNLYYCDAGLAEIGTISLQKKYRKVLVKNDTLDKPRALVLHPQKGIMFWTDWGLNPKVGSANMDGSKPYSVISSNIRYPNGLAIDYVENRLYWTDAGTYKIESSDLNGQNRKVVTSSTTHPYSLTILKNDIYWDDWVTHSISKVDKKSSSIETVIPYIYNGMDVKAYWPEKQTTGYNPCSSSRCSFWCLPIADYPGYRCTCPDNLVDNGNGNCTCPGSEVYQDGECKPKLDCMDNQFKCTNGDCIPLTWKCDMDTDCNDSSDEDKNICNKVKCNANQFTCANNRCLPSLSWHCDGENDCGDGSDEKHCSNCTESTHFLCPNNRCISKSWLCDGDNDCSDGFDEAPAICGAKTTQMPYTEPTQPQFCSQNQFKCKNNNCIASFFKCNGLDDCGDNSDESSCQSTFTPPVTSLKCGFGEAYCADRKECYQKISKCDGMLDCRDGSDEYNCKTMPTTPIVSCTGFRCKTGECISLKKVCDTRKDCPLGEDESICKGMLNDVCYPAPFGFNCTIPDGRCYSHSKMCDKNFDCTDLSDEDPKVCEVTKRVSNLAFTVNQTSVLLSWEHPPVKLKDVEGYVVSYIDEKNKVTEIPIGLQKSYTVTNLKPCRQYVFAVAIAHNNVEKIKWLYTSTDPLRTGGVRKPEGAYNIDVYPSFVSWTEDVGNCFLQYEIIYKMLKCNQIVDEIMLDGDTRIKNMDALLLSYGGKLRNTYSCVILIAYESSEGNPFNRTSTPFQYTPVGTLEAAPVKQQENHSSFKSKAIIWGIPVALVLIALFVGLFVMIYKYRRLQHSFLAFAARGSYAHQDDFDDDNMVVGFHSGEDAPMINRFSDDEPLVVA
uniref:Sortilin-related receptor n=1 Tax=Hydra viridissima TaxID=6082 RepID=O77244_HYDVD|nr:head-activator binding protein precursor [Hydra viridissima]